MSNHSSALKRAGTLALLTAMLFPDASSAVTLDSIRLTPDINALFEGIEYADTDIISKGPGGSGALVAGLSAALPEAVGIDALSITDDDIIFSSDVGFDLGGEHFADHDLILYNAQSENMNKIDGSALGIPESADINALCRETDQPAGTYLMSFSTTVQLPGGIIAADHDIVRYSAGGFSIAYDGVNNLGIEENADIVGLYENSDNLFFSLDKAVTIDGQRGTDHDIWMYSKTNLVSTLTVTELESAAEIAAIDYPTDSDGDWLTDFEEVSELDDPASTIPGTSIALAPIGESDPHDPDSDGDHVPDGEETAAGTSLLHDDDYLQVGDVKPSTDSSVVIEWPSVPGRTYAIDCTEDVDKGFTNEVVAAVVASSNFTIYTNVTGSENAYYRIRLVP